MCESGTCQDLYAKGFVVIVEIVILVIVNAIFNSELGQGKRKPDGGIEKIKLHCHGVFRVQKSFFSYLT